MKTTYYLEVKNPGCDWERFDRLHEYTTREKADIDASDFIKNHSAVEFRVIEKSIPDDKPDFDLSNPFSDLD